jgi:hypothetical protein
MKKKFKDGDILVYTLRGNYKEELFKFKRAMPNGRIAAYPEMNESFLRHGLCKYKNFTAEYCQLANESQRWSFEQLVKGSEFLKK